MLYCIHTKVATLISLGAQQCPCSQQQEVGCTSINDLFAQHDVVGCYANIHFIILLVAAAAYNECLNI